MDIPVLKWNWSTSTNTLMPAHFKWCLKHLKIVLKQTCSQVSVRLADISAQHLWGGHLSEQILLNPPTEVYVSFTPKLSPRGSLLQCPPTAINVLTLGLPPALGSGIGSTLQMGMTPNHKFRAWPRWCSRGNAPQEYGSQLFSLTITADGVKTSSNWHIKLHGTSNSSRTHKSSFSALTTDHLRWKSSVLWGFYPRNWLYTCSSASWHSAYCL